MSLLTSLGPPGPLSSPQRATGLRRLCGRAARVPCVGLVGLIDLYRRFLSPILGSNCRFHPSCSSYARQALLTHGLAAGLALSVWRVLRCQPFCQGGFDPVPEENPIRRVLSRLRGSQAASSQAS